MNADTSPTAQGGNWGLSGHELGPVLQGGIGDDNGLGGDEGIEDYGLDVDPALDPPRGFALFIRHDA